MPHMSSMDATYHATQDLIYAPQSTAPASPLLKLGYVSKESLNTLDGIFRKVNPPVVPPRVLVREVGQKNPKK